MVDLVADPVEVDSVGLIVRNAQECPHYSGVNVTLWGTEMDHYLVGHVVVVAEVEDGHSLMGVDVAVVVDQTSEIGSLLQVGGEVLQVLREHHSAAAVG